MLTTNGDKNRKLVFLEIELNNKILSFQIHIYCSFDLSKFKSWVKKQADFHKEGENLSFHVFCSIFSISILNLCNILFVNFTVTKFLEHRE